MKRCSGCQRLIEAIAGTSFNRKDGTPDGLQPWCRECDFRQKASSQHGWINFCRRLDETGDRHLWTREEYERLMAGQNGERDYSCHYCGSWCPEWSAGYWVDRIDNELSYKPDNCLPCCKPCNFRKSNDGPEQFLLGLQPLLARYRRGRIPWAQVSEKFKRLSPPDLSGYVVEDPQLDFLVVVDELAKKRNGGRR